MRKARLCGTRAHVAALASVLALVGLLLLVSPAAAQDVTPPESLPSSWEALRVQEQAELETARGELEEAQKEYDEAYNPNVEQINLENAQDEVLYEKAELAAAQEGLAAQKGFADADEAAEVTDLKEAIVYYEALSAEYSRAGDEGAAGDARQELEGSAFTPGLYGALEEAQAPPEAVQEDGGSASPAGDDSGVAPPAAAPEPAAQEDTGGFSPLLLLGGLSLIGLCLWQVARRVPAAGGVVERVREGVSQPLARMSAQPGQGQRRATAPHPGAPPPPDHDYDDDDRGPLANPEPDEPDDPKPDEGPGDGGPPPPPGPDDLPPDRPPPDEDPGGPDTGGGVSGGVAPTPRTDTPNRQPRQAVPTLKAHARDMTAAARRGEYDEMVGRTSELEQITEVLARRKVGNAALVGPPGAGKTSLVEGLAQRIVTGKVPRSLQQAAILELDLAGMVGGTRMRGDFEEKLKSVLQEVERLQAESEGVDTIILFIDELHMLAGAGGTSEGTMDAANILKPSLASGRLKVIGATTDAEYRTSIEKDGALARRFERVRVPALGESGAVEVLRRVKGKEESHHGVRVEDSALVASARLAARYVSEQALPASAVNLLATACSRAAMRDEETVTEETVAGVIARSTGVPAGSLTGSDRERIQHLDRSLKAKVVGQDAAVEAVAAAVRRSYAGVRDPGRPVGSFLFLGPTGVGKTSVAKELARQVYGGERSMVRIDMSEYQEQHSVARLIGAPPGYVGHEAAGQLTEAVRQRPHSVVLFDEVEKAHPQVWDTLLQLLDDGRLTDGQGRTVNFTSATIILTSNMASREIGEASRRGEPPAPEDLRELVIARGMRPELTPRMDSLVAFSPLSEESVRKIARLELRKASANLEREHGATLEATDAAIGWVAAEGYDPAEGARPLRRVLIAHLENPLADLVLSEGLRRGDKVIVDAAGSGLTLARQTADAPDTDPPDDAPRDPDELPPERPPGEED